MNNSCTIWAVSWPFAEDVSKHLREIFKSRYEANLHKVEQERRSFCHLGQVRIEMGTVRGWEEAI